MTATDISQVEAAAAAGREDYVKAKPPIQGTVGGPEEFRRGNRLEYRLREFRRSRNWHPGRDPGD